MLKSVIEELVSFTSSCDRLISKAADIDARDVGLSELTANN